MSFQRYDELKRVESFLLERLTEDELAVSMWDDDADHLDHDEPLVGWFWTVERIRADIASKREVIRLLVETHSLEALMALTLPYSDNATFDMTWMHFRRTD